MKPGPGPTLIFIREEPPFNNPFKVNDTTQFRNRHGLENSIVTVHDS